MALTDFDFLKRKNSPELEKAIGGLFMEDEFKLRYVTKKGEEIIRPVYILPVTPLDNFGLIGLFNIDGNLATVPVGVVHQPRLEQQRYYGLVDNRFAWMDPEDTTLYLPLRLLNIFKKNQPHMPYNIFGIRDTPNNFPFVFAVETDRGVRLEGFHTDNKGNLVKYFISNFPGNRFLKSIVEPLRQLESPISRIYIRKDEFDISGIDERPACEPVSRSETLEDKIDWMDARSIESYLDSMGVVGQKDAKKTLSVAFSNYMARVMTGDERIPIRHISLIGPSGTGKSLMLDILVKAARLPKVSTKMTGKSTPGYKDESFGSFWSAFAEQTTEDEPYGVVKIDEIDKMVGSDKYGKVGFGKEQENQLIGWTDEAGELILVGPDEFISTKNILFVFAGAFQGLDSRSTLAGIIEKRLAKKKGTPGLGFSSEVKSKDRNLSGLLVKITPEDLVEYGFRPEFVGRIGYIGSLQNFSKEELITILKESPLSPLRGIDVLMEVKGFDLVIDESLYGFIAENSFSSTNARGMKSFCDKIFEDLFYDPGRYAVDGKIRMDANLAEKLVQKNF